MAKSNSKALEENARLRTELKRLKATEQELRERIAFLESISNEREVVADGQLHA